MLFFIILLGWPAVSDAKRRERSLATPAPCGFGGSTVPDACAALGAGPLLIECPDTLQRGPHFAHSGMAAACVDRNVQRRANVRLQVHEQRLNRLQQGLR